MSKFFNNNRYFALLIVMGLTLLQTHRAEATHCPNGALLGDADGDAVINMLDVVIVIDEVLSGTDDALCTDVNGDGVVNVLDVMQLINIILNPTAPINNLLTELGTRTDSVGFEVFDWRQTADGDLEIDPCQNTNGGARSYSNFFSLASAGTYTLSFDIECIDGGTECLGEPINGNAYRFSVAIADSGYHLVNGGYNEFKPVLQESIYGHNQISFYVDPDLWELTDGEFLMGFNTHGTVNPSAIQIKNLRLVEGP